MKSYLYRLIEGASIEDAEKELSKKGLESIYVIEDDASGEVLIGGFGKKRIDPKLSLLVETKEGVDWENQWTLFAEDFREGKAHIDLSRFGGDGTLELLPGAGFGDLSHPTTYLMLELMKGRIQGETIIDIGTGSGILALAALKLGAKSAVGIDIDEAALKHARRNAKINSLSVRFSKKLPKKLPPESIFLLNMIVPEQQVVGPEAYNRFAKLWIVSGILKEQKKDYLKETKKWGWQLHSAAERNGWLAFAFTPAKQAREPARAQRKAGRCKTV